MNPLSALDFRCPKCGAPPGDACISSGGRYAPKGSDLKRPHRARVEQVPEKAVEHGTYAGYQRHIRQHEPACESCRQARNAWMARYRRERPADYQHHKRQDAARQRALWRLSQVYPDDFQRLVREELAGTTSV